MKKKIQKILAGIMIALMIVSVVPANVTAVSFDTDKSISENTITEKMEIQFSIDEKVKIEAGTDAETLFSIGEQGNKLTAQRGDTIFFKLTSQKNYTVEKVSYKETEIVADQNGIYSFSSADIMDNTPITITSILDEEQNNKVIEETEETSEEIQDEPVSTDMEMEKSIEEDESFSVTASLEETTEDQQSEEASLEEYSSEDTENELISFQIASAKDILKVKKVEMNLALHNGISLKLSSDYKTEGAKEGIYTYYCVKIIPDEGDEENQKPASAKAQTCYIPYNETSQVENFILCDSIDGKKWNYHFTVNLVQSTENDAQNITASEDDTNNVINSSEALEKDFSTKDPYYENNLKLTKKTTTIYTGQKNVLAAIPLYSKNTTYQSMNTKISIYDSKGKPYSSADISAVMAPEGIQVNVNAGAAAGKYTLEVCAQSEDKMNAAKASVTIQIVKGIERVQFSQDQDVPIFKADKRSASYTTSIVYNDGDTSKVPKTKKVIYSLLGYDSSAGAWTQEALSENLSKNVSIKNGKITINKNFQVSDDNPLENQFKVSVSAADYSGDSFAAENRKNISGVFTITNAKTELGKMYLAKYDVSKEQYTVLNKDSFEASEIIGTAKIIIVKKDISEKECYSSGDLIDSSLYSIKFSSTKIRELADGYLSVSGAGKNIKITATTKDGGKQNESIIINITYDQAASFAINYMYAKESGTPVYDITDNAFHYESNNGYGGIAFDICVKKTEESELTRLGKGIYNFSVSVSGGKIADTQEGLYSVVPTAGKTVITLTDKQNGNRKTKYTFIDDSTEAVKPKAPTVSTKDVLYTNSSTWLNYDVNDNKYDYVYIMKDYKSKKSKHFYCDTGEIPIREYAGRNFFDIYFEADIPGRYEVLAVFGTRDAEHDFLPMTKPLVISVNAKAIPDYKPTSHYSIDEKVGFVTLSCQSRQCDYFTYGAYYNAKALNANVKGKPNNFTEYFEVKNGDLVVKKSLADIGKEDLTGYITYFNCKNSAQEEVKVTLKIKKTTYKASAVSIINGSNSTENTKIAGNTKITEGKTAVNISKVYTVLDTKEGAKELETEIGKDGNIKFYLPEKISPGKYNINFYVIPKYSLYDKEGITKEEYITSGIKTISKMTVLDGSKTDKKISINKKDLNIVMNSDDYSWGWGWWEKTIPHKIIYQGTEVESISWAEPDKIPKYLWILKNNKNDEIEVHVNKWSFIEDIDADSNVLGKTATYEAVIHFKNGAKSEKIKVKITTPSYVATIEETIPRIQQAETEFVKEAVPNDKYDAAEEVLHRFNALIPAETDLEIKIKNSEFTAAQVGIEGTFKVQISVMESYESYYDSEELVFPIAALDEPVQTLKQACEAVKDTISNLDIVNDTTDEEIMEAAKKTITNPGIKIIFSAIQKSPATESAPGNIFIQATLISGPTSKKTIDIQKEIKILS